MDAEVEQRMTRKSPPDEAPQNSKAVTDHRDERVYPEGNRHVESDDTGPKRSQKQPGQDLRDPQGEDDDGA